MTLTARHKLLNRLAGAMLGLLLLSLAIGLLVPVYTDEVAWRFQISRFLQDGIDRATGETCGLNTLAMPAYFMLPVRLFSATATAFLSDPLAVRVAGIACAILAVIAMLGLVRQREPASERRAVIEILVLALLGTGVLPFLLVWSRPDQAIWLAMLASLWIAFAPRAARETGEPRARIAAITLLALIAFSYHMKGVFYLPVFVLAVLASGRGVPRYRVRGVALVVILACTWSAYRYWSDRFACPDDPVLAAKLEQQNVMMLLRNGGWRALPGAVPTLLNNMWPTPYIRNTMPATGYMSYWLPATPVPLPLMALWRAMIWFCWYLTAAIAAALIFLAARDRFPQRWMLAAALVLAGCASAWAMLQYNKNDYESSVYLPVLILALVFLWAAPARYRAWLGSPVLTIAALSAISQVLVAGSYAAPLWAAGRGGGYVAGQPYSLSAFAYPRARILAAGAKCGIVLHPGLKRVLIDDLTYFAYAQSSTPMHRLGVLSDWNGSAGDPMAWMRRHGSPGAVLACAYLPPSLRERAIATGDVCCVSTR